MVGRVQRMQASAGRCTDGAIVCEPRHVAWFTPEAEGLLDELRVGRVAADPTPALGGDRPGGWAGLTYVRLHGSPRIYYSSYSDDAIRATLAQLMHRAAGGSECWCSFDNTAAFAATGNALTARVAGVLDDQKIISFSQRQGSDPAG